MTDDFEKINFNSDDELRDGEKKKKRKKSWGNKWWFFLIPLLIIGSFLLWIFSPRDSSVSFVFNKVFSGSSLKSDNDRVNVLLLGNAGGKHDGPLLTDTIIVASYHLKKNEVTLISIPRDVWVDDIKNKVNAIYEFGERKKEGLRKSEEQIGNLLGLPIHYGVRIDFGGFEKAIDTVEGVDVEIPKNFDDYNYPIEEKANDSCGLIEKEIEVDELSALALKIAPGKRKVWVRSDDKIATEAADFACRFEHISFKKGVTHMDGETALKFVRSRMGTNGEGSDFARSRRQQLVIQAFREKVLSLETLFNISKVTGLLDTFGKSFETDIPKERFLDFYNLVKKLEKSESVVLGDLGEGRSLFMTPASNTPYGGAWVLVPVDNDWGKVAQFVREVLEKKVQEEAKIEEKQ